MVRRPPRRPETRSPCCSFRWLGIRVPSRKPRPGPRLTAARMAGSPPSPSFQPSDRIIAWSAKSMTPPTLFPSPRGVWILVAGPSIALSALHDAALPHSRSSISGSDLIQPDPVHDPPRAVHPVSPGQRSPASYLVDYDPLVRPTPVLDTSARCRCLDSASPAPFQPGSRADHFSAGVAHPRVRVDKRVPEVSASSTPCVATRRSATWADPIEENSARIGVNWPLTFGLVR